MIITTTMNVEGHDVKEYKGIVFGEVVEGMNVVKMIENSRKDEKFQAC